MTTPQQHLQHDGDTTVAPAPDRCTRRNRCLAAELDEHDAVVGAVSARPLCDPCTQATASALRDAPELYVRLRLALRHPSQSTGGGEKVTKSKGSPLPLNASALDLTEQLHWLVTTWADEVIHTAGRPAPDRTSQPEAQQIADACALLITYLQVWVVHQPTELATHRIGRQWITIEQAGWQAAATLIDWKRAARRNLGLARLTHRPPEPCPRCNVPGVLERRDGDDKVRCTNCLKEWTLAMYQTFVHAWVGAA